MAGRLSLVASATNDFTKSHSFVDHDRSPFARFNVGDHLLCSGYEATVIGGYANRLGFDGYLIEIGDGKRYHVSAWRLTREDGMPTHLRLAFSRTPRAS